MALSIDSLIAQLSPARAPGRLSSDSVAALANGAVIKAIVLSSTELTAAAGAGQKQQFTVAVSDGGRRFDIVTPSPLPVDALLELQLSEDKRGLVVKVLSAVAGRIDNGTLLNASTVSNTDKPAIALGTAALPPTHVPSTAEQEIIQQILQLLPKQQTMRQLLPVLQHLHSDAPADLPRELLQASRQLLKLLPLAAQMQRVDTLKHFIANSGIFLESKLAYLAALAAKRDTPPPALAPSPARPLPMANVASSAAPAAALTVKPGDTTSMPTAAPTATNMRVATNTGTPTISTTPPTAPARQLETKVANAGSAPADKPPAVPDNMRPRPAERAVVDRDIKAGMQRLLAVVEQVQSRAGTPNASPPLIAANGPSAPLTSGAVVQSSNDALTYLQRPLIPTETGVDPIVAKHNDDNTDVLLQQLGKLLQSSLARTQLNQLESLQQRAGTPSDSQPNPNSYVLEIPIVHHKHIDNLRLQINEETVAGGSRQSKTHKVWRVMLGFDLHALGKLSVQLHLSGKAVNATLWSQLAGTHALVQQHVDDFQKGLSSIGVTVQRVDCQLGTPPAALTQWHRQRVDLHT